MQTGSSNTPGTTNTFVPPPLVLSMADAAPVAPPPPSSFKNLSLLVTVGATAPFPALAHAALCKPFLATLCKLGFTNLRLQAGETFATASFQTALTAAIAATAATAAATTSKPDSSDSPSEGPGIEIDAFDFHPELGLEVVSAVDVVISHAGAGSILDALRWDKELIVVENTALMGGHQRELIDELVKRSYLVEGTVDTLAEAVEFVVGLPKQEQNGAGGNITITIRQGKELEEGKRKREKKQFPPSGSAKIMQVLKEEMGIMKEG